MLLIVFTVVFIENQIIIKIMSIKICNTTPLLYQSPKSLTLELNIYNIWFWKTFFLTQHNFIVEIIKIVLSSRVTLTNLMGTSLTIMY